MGVIDSLSQGFRQVSRHWWIILIPVLLDAFLWLGPQASIAPILDRVAEILPELAEMSDTGMDTAEWTAVMDDVLATIAERYNMFTLLRARAFGMPSLLAWGDVGLNLPSIYEVIWVYFLQMIDIPDLLISVSRATFMTVRLWTIQSEGFWLFASMGTSVVGVFVGSIYFTLVSDSLSQEPAFGSFWGRVSQLGGRVLLFWVARAVAMIILGVPFFLLFVVLALINPGLGFLFMISGMGALTWLSFYGVFFMAALAINHVSIWQAIWNSLNVVMRNFWTTLWLFVLINLVGGGLTILWQELSHGSWWTFVGIIGNAYVGSGLLAGSLIFYRDRYTRWRDSIANILNNRKQAA
ncbi:MAG: hypothetical protein JXA89_25490 [Anaerolineae bacterium]|nr:hypothetical protein [Anaerolineae bacterium]